jgi:uncharacterized protein YcnI
MSNNTHAIGANAPAKNHSNTIFKNVLRGVVALSVALAGLFATTAPASAHASTQMYGESATAGGYGAVFIRIPHAAAGLNTVKIEVQIPEGVTSVKPQRVAGWSESNKLAADGKTVASVIWDGGSLPDTSFADFGISVKFPATPGATLYFKTLQTLSDGSTVAWIEIPAAGVDAHSLAKPAPALTLKAAAPAHGTMPETGTSTGHMPEAGTSTGHMPEAVTPAHSVLRWTGDVAVVLGSKLAKVTADVSSVHAGKTAEIRLVTANGMVSLLKGKLDTRGDLVKSIAKTQKGKITWSLKSGDKVELLVSGKVVAEATI